jgi:outer membrane protein assembly factor BamB
MNQPRISPNLRLGSLALSLSCAILMNVRLSAQDTPMAPTDLPGRGLAQHQFFYAGEQKQHQMFIVKHGRVVWSYVDANSKGEISDAVLLSNGNILFAHQFGVTLITQDKRVLWNFDAPQGTEIHTAQPIGKEHVLFIQNGAPALLRVVNITTGTIVREFKLPTGDPKSVHGHFRHARLTDAGTILVAHMDMKKVAEYDSTGKEVWSYAVESPWSAERLGNGNTLITTNKKLVLEVDPKGTVVWQLKPEDMPGYQIQGFQIATRLPSGNTLVNNWVNQWSTTVDKNNPPVQALEFTPDKTLVWVLRSWDEAADLGPATTIQVLDRPIAAENVHFGDIR